MITDGWNSQKRARITQQDPGHVEDALKENEMIPGEWNRQREASNTQQLLALLKALCRKRLFLADEIFRRSIRNHQTIHMKSHAIKRWLILMLYMNKLNM